MTVIYTQWTLNYGQCCCFIFDTNSPSANDMAGTKYTQACGQSEHQSTVPKKKKTESAGKSLYLLSRLIYFTPTRMALMALSALSAHSQGNGARLVRLRGGRSNLWRQSLEEALKASWGGGGGGGFAEGAQRRRPPDETESARCSPESPPPPSAAVKCFC